jgi:hypothetical protein
MTRRHESSRKRRRVELLEAWRVEQRALQLGLGQRPFANDAVADKALAGFVVEKENVGDAEKRADILNELALVIPIGRRFWRRIVQLPRPDVQDDGEAVGRFAHARKAATGQRGRQS